MSGEFVDREVERIVSDKELKFPLNMAMAAAWILGNQKGINLKILDVKNTSSLADYFILASATNPVQAKSMVDEIIKQLKKHGQQVISKEGTEGADWILLDLGNILVHIFLEASREAYDLDGLWSSAKMIPIPQSYYFSSTEETSEESQKESDRKSYF